MKKSKKWWIAGIELLILKGAGILKALKYEIAKSIEIPKKAAKS